MIKKLVSVIAAVSIIFSCFTSVYAADSKYKYFSEKDIRQFEKQCDFLQTMKVFYLKERDISSTITRIEFAQILTNLTDASMEAESADTTIAVDLKGDSAKYGAHAIEAGYMKINGNGEFLPDEALTYNDAIYGFVRVLGYGLIIEDEHEKASTYASIASKIGISKNSEIYGDYPIVLGALLDMIENSLSIELFGWEPFSDGYSVLSGQTIMSEYLNTVKLKGILYGTAESHIIRENGVGECNVEINGTRYLADADYSDYLGMLVDYYIAEDDSDIDTIVYMCENTKNEVFKLDAKKVQVNGSGYTYDDEGKIRTVDTETGLLTIYNGSALSVPTLADRQPQNGYFEFIDNDGNGDFDIVKITSYSHYVVGSLEPEKLLIYDKYKPANKLRLEDYKFVKIYGASGAEIPFGNIAVDDVLTAVVNKQQNVARLFVSKTTVEGAVTEIKTDTYQQLTIGGKSYPKAPDYSEGETIQVLSQGIFRLNINGQVVSFEKKAEEIKFGYLIGAEKTEGLSSEVKLKVFTQDKDMIVAPVSAITKIDETVCRKPIEAYNALKKGFTEPQAQVVQYKLVDGEFTQIITAYNNNASDMSTDPTMITPTGSRSKDSLRVLRRKDAYYSSLLKTLGNIGVSDNTIKFVVPSDPSTATDDDYGIQRSISTESTYTCELYACNETNIVADAMVIFGENSGETKIGVVSKIRHTIDSEKNPCTQVTLYSYPEVTETIVAYNGEMNAVQGLNDGNTYVLGVGDTVQYSSKGSKKEVDNIKLLCDASENGMSRVKCTNPTGGVVGGSLIGTELRFSYGAIYEKAHNFFQLAFCDPSSYLTGVPSDLTELYSIDGMYEIVVDTSGREPTVTRSAYSAMNFNDYKKYSTDCDYGFVYLQWGWARIVVVYK